MRLTNSVVLSAAMVGAVLSACGPAGQPRIYRVAIDVSPITTLADPQCFHSNMTNNADTIVDTQYRSETQWVVWDAAEQKQFLDMGNSKFNLGDAPTITVSDSIEGGQNVFTANRQELLRGLITEQRSTTITVNFSDLGATPTGTIALDAQYQCANAQATCPSDPLQRSCKATLNWVARKIEVQQLAPYTPVGGGINVSTR
jgi:hypothetical protein